MSQSILYYNSGRKCQIKLLVSVHSLRKVYDGPVTLLWDDMEDWVKKILESYNVALQHITTPKVEGALVRKPQLYRHSPYDYNVFFDADTIILKNPEPLFDVLKTTEFFTTHFAGWKTDGHTMAKRIRNWIPVIGEEEANKAIAYGGAVNTGVFGWSKGATIFPEWERITIEGFTKNCTRRIVDEMACQVLLHKYPHKLLDYKWNCSVRHGPQEDPNIIHYHGYKHVHPHASCEHWKRNYWDLHNTSTFTKELEKPVTDKRFKRYMAEVRKKDLTIVTACNAEYIDKARKNFPEWMKMRGLREQQFIVFTNGLGRRGKRFWSQYTNVKMIPWEFPLAGDNIRERMLSAFVFGTAKHVTTPYWMKLDIDCAPKTDEFVFPEYTKYTCIGHKWGYTKCKGDPNATEHWFNRLDDWWGGERHFDKRYDLATERKVAHPRFCSFCYFEKTDFTRRLAARCGDRLPIPSQDTLAWYAATRWNEPVLRANLKKWFAP